MKISLNETSRLNFVPLRDAMLCVECEFLTPAGNDKCSICGRGGLVSLADLLRILLDKACGTSVPSGLPKLARPLAADN